MPNVLPVEQLKVRSLDVDRLEVTWEVSDTQEDALDYTFEILRSESPEGPFDPITAPFEDRYLFVDSRIPAGDKFRLIWYKLRVTHKASSTVREHGPIAQEPEPDLIAGYIRRAEMTLFTQAIGRQCWLFKRRTFGPRCPSCWDKTLHKRTRGNCLDCYSTGFLRGYLDPIEVWVQIDPETKAQENQSQQISQQVTTTARMGFYPIVTPGDLLVEAENKRWRIVRVAQSQRLRATIKQEMSLGQVNNTDVEYRLPINLTRALRDIQPSPSRMFTNPSDMNSVVDERTPNVFANYATYPTDLEE